MSSYSGNRAARFARIAASGGCKHTTQTVGVTVVTHTCDPKCVAVRFFNLGSATVFFRGDGTDPTTTAGFPILTSSDTGWFDCDGSWVVELISGTAGQRVEVMEILDA